MVGIVSDEFLKEIVMNEPLMVRAQAGKPPQSVVARLINALAIQSYVPDPNDPRKLAFDLSQYEPDLNLALVESYIPDVALCIFRICGSYTVKDTMFPTFWPWAKRVGLTREMFLYNWPGWTVDQHIGNLMDSIEKYADGYLGKHFIWLDAECHAGKTRREVTDHTFDLLDAVESETGMPVGIYTGPWFLSGYMEKRERMKEIKWWLAQWYSDQASEHPGPPQLVYDIPRENVLWHQTGSRCRAQSFGGTSYLDTDRWELTEAEFEIYYGDDTIPPPPNPDYEARFAAVETRVNKLEDWQHHILSYGG